MENETEVRQLVENWALAVRQHDMARIMAHHAADFVMFDVPPPFESRGLSEYKKTWDLFFGWAQDAGVFDIVDMTVVAGADVAFCYATMRCGGYKPNGDREQIKFRLTVGLQKVDGQWLIKHEHHSVPSED